MNFCSNCGAPEIILSIPQGDNKKRHVCEKCDTIHYQNPKIIVGCIPVFEDKILLAQRNIQPQKGLWNLPAGFMENGETLEQGATREVLEETGAKVTIERLFAIYNIPHFNQVFMMFLARMSDSFFEAGVESGDIQFFSKNEIPFDRLAFKSNVFTLEKYLNQPDYQSVHFNTYELDYL
jgi:ADP-ribose pyrophosphatase YjhB (NUDIX family)